MTTRLKESDVGEVVKQYLLDSGHDVYCEAEGPSGRIDMVALSGSVVTAVEVKATLSMDVLGQAIDRRGYCHRSVAAFPMPKANRYKRLVAESVANQTGIGLWVVERNSIRELVAPTICRSALTKYIVPHLHDEQKSQSPGVNRNYWSPFRDTKYRLSEYVAANPGCTLKDAMREIKHHYASHSSAYNSMGQWIRQGVVDGIEYRDGGLHLVRTEAEPCESQS